VRSSITFLTIHHDPTPTPVHFLAVPAVTGVQDSAAEFFKHSPGVYVHPDFRKQGLFRLLYNHVKMEAMNAGAGTPPPFDICLRSLYVEPLQVAQ